MQIVPGHVAYYMYISESTPDVRSRFFSTKTVLRQLINLVAGISAIRRILLLSGRQSPFRVNQEVRPAYTHSTQFDV